jgi:hypothetical protein
MSPIDPLQGDQASFEVIGGLELEQLGEQGGVTGKIGPHLGGA